VQVAHAVPFWDWNTFTNSGKVEKPRRPVRLSKIVIILQIIHVLVDYRSWAGSSTIKRGSACDRRNLPGEFSSTRYAPKE